MLNSSSFSDQVIVLMFCDVRNWNIPKFDGFEKNCKLHFCYILSRLFQSMPSEQVLNVSFIFYYKTQHKVT
jgi:hypothetical protein